MFAIPKLPYATYLALTQTSSILKERHHRPYVLLNNQGIVIKHFYKRPWWSFSTLWPYPLRFIRNCQCLAKSGWNVPEPQQVYNLPEKNCFIVTYPHIAGKTLRQHFHQNNFSLFDKFPGLIAKLHHDGIYLRDLHSDNIIVKPDESFALIDLVGTKIFSHPLSLKRRARNLMHLFTSEKESKIFEIYGIGKFLNEYFKHSQLTEGNQKIILSYLKKFK